MRYNNIELQVKVKNKTITEYPHNGQVFIEGRADSNFEILVTNHNNYRVEAVLSVDGLSVLDGKDAGPQSQGYLLNANETIAIPGWTLNDKQVAAFQFAGKEASYTAQSTGSARNTGVIGVLAYRERYVAPNYTQPLYFTSQQNNPLWNVATLGGGYVPTHSSAVNTLNLNNVLVGGSISNSMGVSGATGAQGARGISGAEMAKSWSSPGFTETYSTVATGMDSAMCFNAIGASASAADSSPFDIARHYSGNEQTQNLGTAFGQCQGFETTSVSFNRGDMQAMLVLYYDNARGLKARGIQLARTKKDRQQVAPNAFPGLSGCTPPAGWQG